jgi:Phage portal protein, lambda family
LSLISRIAGAARLLATGKLAQSASFDGAQMQRRLVAWRAGGESINSLTLQGGELQRARARQLVRTNPYAANAAASFTARAVGCGIKPSSLVEGGGLKDRVCESAIVPGHCGADESLSSPGVQLTCCHHVAVISWKVPEKPVSRASRSSVGTPDRHR